MAWEKNRSNHGKVLACHFEILSNDTLNCHCSGMCSGHIFLFYPEIKLKTVYDMMYVLMPFSCSTLKFDIDLFSERKSHRMVDQVLL